MKMCNHEAKEFLVDMDDDKGEALVWVCLDCGQHGYIKSGMTNLERKKAAELVTASYMWKLMEIKKGIP